MEKIKNPFQEKISLNVDQDYDYYDIDQMVSDTHFDNSHITLDITDKENYE